MSERVQVAAKKPETKRENRPSQTQKTCPSQSISSPIDQILFLQRTIGNQAVGRLIKSGVLQAKLRIGQPGDIYEQEADRVAEQVMRMPEPQVSKETEVSNPARNNSIQRKCPGCKKGTKIGKEEEEEKLQKKEAAGLTPEVTPELESSISAFRGGGQPLPESMRAFYEPRFGADFTGVRVHVDTRAAETAKSINARAFTAGQNIAFGAGHYAPESREGRRLLAHELAHIVQQSDGMAPATWPMHMGEGIEVSRADDPLQAEDHMFAGRAASSTIFREGERDLRKLEPYYPYQTSEYIERFGDKIKGDLRAEMRGVVLPIGSRFVSWVAGSESRFIESILGTLLANGGKALEADLNRYLTPPAVASAINLGREIGSIEYKWLGGKDYFPAVALEMRKVLAKQLADSVPRIVPRYLAARNQAALAEQVRTKQSQTTPPEPDQARIIASVPIDRLVIPALCAGTVTVNLDAYRAARPEERRTRETQSLRTIAEGDWRFESVQGLWSWIRVFRPEDTTIEEVAKLLYGDETHSRRIVPAPPFFGFDPDRLSGAMLDRWEAQAGKDEGDIQYRILKDVPSPNPGQRETTLQHGYDPGRSAAVELLHGTQADEIALIQARGLKPTGATRDTIVSRIAVSLKLLDRSAADAKRFGLNFEPARTRLQERLDILKSLVDPRLAHRWDAESAGQLAILQRAMIGLRVAATYHAAMEKQAPPQQTVGPPSTYSFFVTPVIELGRTYVEVAQISELVVTAQQKLGEGDDRAKRLPLDFAEARLRMMRQTLAHAAIDKLHPEQRYSPTALETKGIAGLSREEMRLSHQIAAVREQLAIDPDAAVSKLNALGVEFDKLQLGVQLTGIVEHLWELFSTTLEGYSGSSGLGAIFNSGDYKVEMSRILLWLKRWERLLQSYREGKSDSTQFKKELKELGENPEWKKLFESVLSRLRDLKQREAWINFGAKIAALVAIALVTAGVGALAEGAGLGFWATAGLEAFSFTALTLPFEEKASVQGFFLHLFQNWATFGLVKGAMALYEAAVGEKFARTLLGKGIGGVASFATATTTMIVQAEIESLARRNRSLTASEIKWITGESTAVTFATILAARYARPFLTELRIHGEAFHVEIETINAMRTENAALAKIVKETKSLSLAKKLAEADGKQADIEGEVLHKLSRDGAESKDRDGRPLSPEQRQAVADLTKAKAGEPSPLAAAMSEQAGVARARMLVDMESAGPDLFLAEPGKDIIDIAKRFHDAGAEITGPEYNADGSRSILVDFKDGHPFEVMERAPEATLVTRPAEATVGPGREGTAPSIQERAAEVAPEIEALQERAASAARQAERAQAEQIESASTKIPPEERRVLIKQNGEKLLKAANRSLNAKKAEVELLQKRMDRERRKIIRRQREIDEARKEVPGKKKKTWQIEAEVERLNQLIRKFAAVEKDLGTRASNLHSEIDLLNETIGTAKRMIDGRETDTLPCFPPGTPVWTTCGPRPIETLAPGTPVACWDHEQGTRCAGVITQVHRHSTRWLYHIATPAGLVDATGDHRFWVEDGGWTSARDLRPGMRLCALDSSALVESVTLLERETPTYNLSIEPFPMYFVGSGLLVHNAAPFHFGDLIIYEGYNERFPDLIYIGQTNDLRRREREHNAEGRKGLEKKFLTEQEKLFFEFKKGMKLRPRLTGLNEDTADYFEQVNKNWEETVRGDDKVMNRFEIVAEKNWPDIVKRVTELHCPK